MKKAHVIACNDAILAVAEGSEDFANQLCAKMKKEDKAKRKKDGREDISHLQYFHFHTVPVYEEE